MKIFSFATPVLIICEDGVEGGEDLNFEMDERGR